jgi:hypothetical protein
MKKVLMVVALLLLATPAFAVPDVTITATLVPIGDINKADANWTRALTIGYTGAAEANSIRAFALVLNTDGGAHLDRIRDYNRGESKVPGGGYGIFPASFRSYITPYNGTDVNSWNDPRYSPLALWPDVNSGGGNDNVNMVVELGTLFVEPNSPGTSGTLFTVDVNSEGVNDCNVWIALDQIRGGVVKKDNTAADVCIPGGGIYVKFKETCTTIPDITGMTKAAADAAITAVGLVPNGTGAQACACAYGTVCTTPVGCVTAGSTVNYNYETGRSVPNIVGLTQAAGCTALTNAGLCCGTVTTKYSDTVAAGIVISQGTASGTCVADGTCVTCVVSLGKFPTPTQLIYPTYDPDCNLPIYWSAVAGATGYDLERSANSGSTYTATPVSNLNVTFKADSITVGPTYRYRVRARNADSTSDYKTVTFDCNAILSTCYRGGNTADGNWATWKSAGRPDCWCAAKGANQGPRGTGYQCDGDANQDTEVVGTMAYRVYTSDMTRLTQNWKKTAAMLTSDPNVGVSAYRVAAGCADIDHKSEVVGTMAYRVYTVDMSRLTGNWKKLSSSSVTATNKLPGNCPR